MHEGYCFSFPVTLVLWRFGRELCLGEEDDLEVAGRPAAVPGADGVPGGESCRVPGAATQAARPVPGERAGHRRGTGHRPAPGPGIRPERSQEGEQGGEGEHPPAALPGSPVPPPLGGIGGIA